MGNASDLSSDSSSDPPSDIILERCPAGAPTLPPPPPLAPPPPPRGLDAAVVHLQHFTFYMRFIYQ